MSLGSGLDALGNTRLPMFIEDYTCAYYLDPNVFRDDNIHGALLYHFPRKWEMYSLRSSGGFRLVAQHRVKPSTEKVLVEYLWRSDMIQKSNKQQMNQRKKTDESKKIRQKRTTREKKLAADERHTNSTLE